MFLADLPGFKNPLFLNFKNKSFLAHPISHAASWNAVQQSWLLMWW